MNTPASIRHYDIKCIPLREEMDALDAAEERDRAEMLAGLAIYVFGLATGACGTFLLGWALA